MGMFDWLKRRKASADMTAEPRMTANPIVVSPDASTRIQLAAARLRQIRTYEAERRAEGRPIPAQRQQELDLEAAVLERQLAAAGVEV